MTQSVRLFKGYIFLFIQKLKTDVRKTMLNSITIIEKTLCDVLHVKESVMLGTLG